MILKFLPFRNLKERILFLILNVYVLYIIMVITCNIREKFGAFKLPRKIYMNNKNTQSIF